MRLYISDLRGAPCPLGFITLLCVGVWRCAGTFLWNRAVAKVAGFQTTGEQHGRVHRHWASCQETWFLCHLLHYLLSLVRVHWGWLWAWSCDLFWPMGGGHARKQVVSWASVGPHDSLLFCFCQHREKNLPWATARISREGSPIGPLANLHACEQKTSFCCCKPEFCGCLAVGIITAIFD